MFIISIYFIFNFLLLFSNFCPNCIFIFVNLGLIALIFGKYVIVFIFVFNGLNIGKSKILLLFLLSFESKLLSVFILI